MKNFKKVDKITNDNISLRSLYKEFISEPKITKEGVDGDNLYKIKAKLDTNYYKTTYKSNEINDVTTDSIDVTFLIDMDIRSWGIKDISVYNIKGPSEIELYIQYYQDNSDEEKYVTVTVPLDWEKVIMEKNEDLGFIGISSNIDIDLTNDDKGNIIVKSMTVQYNSI